MTANLDKIEENTKHVLLFLLLIILYYLLFSLTLHPKSYTEYFDRKTYHIRGYRPRSVLRCWQWASADNKIALSQAAHSGTRQRDTRAR